MSGDPDHTFWHGSVRVTVRDRGPSGVVISIEIADPGGWREAIKIDAFDRAHWHLCSRHDGEHVQPLHGTGTLRGGRAILGDLPDHLEAAGYPEAAAEVASAGALDRLQADIDKAVEALSRRAT